MALRLNDDDNGILTTEEFSNSHKSFDTKEKEWRLRWLTERRRKEILSRELSEKDFQMSKLELSLTNQIHFLSGQLESLRKVLWSLTSIPTAFETLDESLIHFLSEFILTKRAESSEKEENDRAALGIAVNLSSSSVGRKTLLEHHLRKEEGKVDGKNNKICDFIFLHLQRPSNSKLILMFLFNLSLDSRIRVILLQNSSLLSALTSIKSPKDHLNLASQIISHLQDSKSLVEE